jgi:hypothetical protein
MRKNISTVVCSIGLIGGAALWGQYHAQTMNQERLYSEVRSAPVHTFYIPENLTDIRGYVRKNACADVMGEEGPAYNARIRELNPSKIADKYVETSVPMLQPGDIKLPVRCKEPR